MSRRRSTPPRIVAIFPSRQGFGFAVFEGPASPIDWGVRRGRPNDRKGILLKVEALFDWFQPDTVVVENCAGEGSRRAPRIERLIRTISRKAEQRDYEVVSYSRGLIRQCFAPFGARNKQEIAAVIGREFTEYEPHVPPPRKPWVSEAYRMGMFDAASLVLTHFYIASSRSEEG